MSINRYSDHCAILCSGMSPGDAALGGTFTKLSGDEQMRIEGISQIAVLSLIGITFFGLTVPFVALSAESQILAGTVSSAEEGEMEGVIVSAKREGSPITVSVVSNAEGYYRFPSDRLEPGDYAISARAVGYDLASSGSIEISSEPVTLDLQLTKTRRLSAQLSNGEWMISAPGTFEEKQYFDDCTMCHTLKRPMTSRYGQEDMAKVVQRMGAHTLNSTPAFPHFKSFVAEMLSESLTEEEIDKGRYFSSVNLSASDFWEFDFK